MKRAIAILATVVLTLTLLASAAEARSGGGHVGGFGSGVHMGGGFGSGVGHMGGEHPMRRFMPGYAPGCYYPDEAPKLPPWPPFCD